MTSRLILILILVVCGKLVQTKSFLCISQRHPEVCEINDVSAKDTSIVLTTSHETIKELQIKNSTIDDIPPISSISSNKSLDLSGLSCVKCGLTDIKESSFTAFSKLQFLDISFGSYSILQKNLFSRLPSLNSLLLNDGAIAEVDDTAFFNLTKLMHLSLKHNKISKIRSRMFASLESLWVLDLSYNHIRILDEGLFINNANLYILDLSHNHINRIDGQLFKPQHSAAKVILSHNELTTLDTMKFSALELFVNHNKIKVLSISNTVNSLYCDGNHIEKVICDERGSAITSLGLPNNSITELGCIGSLDQLKWLDLRYNKLAPLSGLTKSNSKSKAGIFSNLRDIDISHNRMGNTAFELVFPAKSLEILRIHGNNITEIPYDLRTAFTNLTKIGIAENDFNCTFLEPVLDHLRLNDIQATGDYTYYKFSDISCHDKNETRNIYQEPTEKCKDSGDCDVIYFAAPLQ